MTGWRLLDRAPVRASQWLLGIGLALALGGVVVVSALMVRERGEVISTQLERNELLARVLEDHATRSIEAVSLALSTLAELMAREDRPDRPAFEAAFRQTLVNLPFLRGLAVVDGTGRVVAGSDPGDRGLVIDLARLGELPPPGPDVIGPFVAGRRLQDLASDRREVRTPPGLGFIPLMRTVPMRGTDTLHLVALLNPDAFANFQEVTLADEKAAAALLTYDGRVLAATRSSGQEIGRDRAALPPFRRFLPATEHGAWVGDGLRPQAQIAAFRVLRSRPLVVLVEVGRAEIVSGWMRQMVGVLVVTIAAVVSVLLMTITAFRSLRARESARAALDAAQAEVARRERELSVIFSSVQEVLFRTDARGVLTFINARWESASGRPVAEALGRALSDLVVAEDRPALLALLESADGRGVDAVVRRARVRLERADGDSRIFDLALIPLPGDQAIAGYAGSAIDTTETLAAQTALRSQLAFTDSLLESNPLPVSVLDAQGLYLRVNRAWEEFFGRQRDAVVGTPASGYFPGKEAAQHDERDLELMSGRSQRVRYEALYSQRDGSQRALLVTKSAVIGAGGRPEAIVTTFMDISEFREAERATREARDAAEETSRAKSEFIANISHELRTPLQSILGFSELGKVRSREHVRFNSMFEDIHRAGGRMLALVNDLLDVSKLESTVGTMLLERADLRRLVQEVAAELQPLCTPRGLRIDLDLPPEPLLARVDPPRFQQVVRNVLANALRFSPDGGVVEVRGEAAGGAVVLSVSDRGPGIPPAETEKIFEAFVQSSKTKDGSGGTGLGLAICRKIMQAHDGGIDAANRPDGGSVFHIRLPGEDSAQAAGVTAA